MLVFALPIKPGRRLLFGDVGVGKTVVIMELINNIALKHRGYRVSSFFFLIIWHQVRKLHWCTDRRGASRVDGLTVAGHFRDEEGQDVLLFVDNFFPFHAGWLGGVRVARAYWECCWLSTYFGDRACVFAGLYYDDAERLDYAGSNCVRSS